MPCEATTVDGVREYVVHNLKTHFYSIFNPDVSAVMFEPKSGTNPMLSLELTRLIPDVFGFSCSGRGVTIMGENKIAALEAAGVPIDRANTRSHIQR
ncbi:MAG: hypothetical protein J0M34_04345 [Alphaproteobacteria bacterium]|nr:hypothetical protein [Alphaproteobacteria bacterium]